MSIKLIIFDMDGVLVDACDLHYMALNNALHDKAGFIISREEHLAKFNGIPTKKKLEKLVLTGRLSSDLIDEISDLKQQYTSSLASEMINFDHNIFSVLNYLWTSKKYKLACYTNSIRSTAEDMLKRVGAFGFLDLIISNEDVSVPKPSPQGYIKVMEYFDISPEETLIYEDSPVGLAAAFASKARYVIKVASFEDIRKTTYYLDELKELQNEHTYTNGR